MKATAASLAIEAVVAERRLREAATLFDVVALRSLVQADRVAIRDAENDTSVTWCALAMQSRCMAVRLAKHDVPVTSVVTIPDSLGPCAAAVAYFGAQLHGCWPVVTDDATPGLLQLSSQIRIESADDLPGVFVSSANAADLGPVPDQPPGDLLIDPRTGKCIFRAAPYLRWFLSGARPKLLPMIHAVASAFDAGFFSSELGWSVWAGRTMVTTLTQDLGKLFKVIEHEWVQSIILKEEQCVELRNGFRIKADLTAVREVYVAPRFTDGAEDAAFLRSVFTNAVVRAYPMLDQQVLVMSARMKGGIAAPARNTGPTSGDHPSIGRELRTPEDEREPIAVAEVPELDGALPGGAGLYLELLASLLTRSYADSEFWPTADPMLYRRTDVYRVARELGRDWPPDAETMVGRVRLRHLALLVAQVVKESIPGDLVEAGAWRGGACILMRGALKVLRDETRKVWVADSFQGFPDADYTAASGRSPVDTGRFHYPFIEVGMEIVAASFRRYGLLDERVVFVPGWFEDTLQAIRADAISVLRVDADLYDSTWQALSALYPRLSPGGFCVVDDYGSVAGCRDAVNDFRHLNEIDDPAAWIDPDAIYWRKERAIANATVFQVGQQ